MHESTTNQSECQLFPSLFPLSAVCNKEVNVSFTAPDLFSEGGLLLLREFDNQTGFIDQLTNCIEDRRVSYLIQHPYKEMLTQRIFQISCGYGVRSFQRPGKNSGSSVNLPTKPRVGNTTSVLLSR